VYLGPLVSGVVGEQRFQFDVWGDTVNVAARLCGVSDSGTIAITAEHWAQLQRAEEGASLSGRSLGQISLKGLGEIEVYEVR
jgi:class 3 adenylate cyclase